MTLDEELRAALTARAHDVPPAADPLAGIQRRATQIRRRRTAVAVTGTALAVLAVAGAVPALLPDRTARPDQGLVASSGPSSGPSSDPSSDPSSGPSSAATSPPAPRPSSAPSRTGSPDSPLALDPLQPWDYRGTRLSRDTLTAFSREWAVRHPGSELVPLFGQVYEPSASPELVFLGRGGGPRRWGVVRSSESGPEFVVDQPLPSPALALAAALPGDEVARLLVVTTPAAGAVRYRADDAAPWREMAPLAPGVGVVALEGDPDRDAVQVLDGDGDLDRPLYQGPAPDLRASGAQPGGGGAGAAPASVLDWPTRGTIDPAVLLAAKAAYARGRDAARNDVHEKVLFAGDDDAGNDFLVGQMWLDGDTAVDTVGWVDGPGSEEPELQLKARVTDGAEVVALYVGAAPGQAVDTLVVVPRPGTGQVLYAEAGSPWRPVSLPSGLDGVALVDRKPDAQGDRLRLLDGNGRVFFEDEVASLLCGVTSCS